MNGRLQGYAAVALGLFVVLAGSLTLLSDAEPEGWTPLWLPMSRELFRPLAIAEILLGLGLAYQITRRASGAILALLVFLAGCLTVYSMLVPADTGTITKEEMPAELANWKLILHDGWQASATRPELQIPRDSPRTLRIRINATTQQPEPWHIQLARSGISLVKDQDYILRFRARAGGVRPMDVRVGRAYGDYTNLGLSQTVTVTENWQQFEVAFRATDSDPQARIAFDMGQDASTVELASITLARRRPDAPPPLAKLWQLNLNQAPDDPRLLARLEFPVAPPQSLRVRIFKTTAERQAWHIQLNRGGISVVNRRFYVLRFRARASGARSIYASVGKAYGDYGNLGLYDEVFITKDWELFQLTFDAKGTEPNARIAFDLGKTAQDVEISEVSLMRTDAEFPDSQNINTAPSNSDLGSEWIVGAPDSDADVPTPQDPLVQKSLWPQLLMKPAWMLVLLWCSGFLSKRAAVEQEC